MTRALWLRRSRCACCDSNCYLLAVTSSHWLLFALVVTTQALFILLTGILEEASIELSVCNTSVVLLENDHEDVCFHTIHPAKGVDQRNGLMSLFSTRTDSGDAVLHLRRSHETYT